VASPVAANGNIYLCSEPGTITVLKAADNLQVLNTVELGEKILATPAIVGDAIYVRTQGGMLAFGAKR
jgi:outer membrane protein assembly factor BamB